MARTSDPRPRHIALLGWKGMQTLDLVGPWEVFAAAGEHAAQAGEPRPYRLELLSTGEADMRSASGLVLGEGRHYGALRTPPDTLLVAGGSERGLRAAAADARLVRWLARMSERTRRIGSVCTGAFLLAQAGVLDGRRATTHWGSTDELQAMFPRVRVEPDPIFVRDGNVYTSAGVTAGMDLALALVEEDLGRDAALAVARRLVMFLQRPGGQAQFSAELDAQTRAEGPLETLPAWIRSHLEDDLSVEALAQRVAMSPRNFARVFRRQFGRTPARFVEAARIERARRQLEEGRLTLGEIADQCGFGSAERMRRSFQRQLRVVPNAYRDRFRERRAAG